MTLKGILMQFVAFIEIKTRNERRSGIYLI